MIIYDSAVLVYSIVSLIYTLVTVYYRELLYSFSKQIQKKSL